MNTADFTRDVQRFLSVSAVGVSALRRQGVGVIPAIQAYLAEMDLSNLCSIRNQASFNTWLDEQTDAIVAIQHSPSIRWGAARKALNLFLRDCLYNKYLSSEYNIETVEAFLEVPLDSVISKELKHAAGRGRLPIWRGLKQLRSDDSARFQEYASFMASQKKLHRVHLDVGLWVNNR